jgi:hypothetical protein
MSGSMPQPDVTDVIVYDLPEDFSSLKDKIRNYLRAKSLLRNSDHLRAWRTTLPRNGRLVCLESAEKANQACARDAKKKKKKYLLKTHLRDTGPDDRAYMRVELANRVQGKLLYDLIEGDFDTHVCRSHS